MVEGAGLLGVWQGVDAAFVLDGYVPLFDVYVRGAVLAHRAELYEVALGDELPEREEEVHRAYDVVHLGEDGVATVDHGVRRRALLAELHEGLGLEATNRLVYEAFVSQVADGHPDPASRKLLPPSHTGLEVTDPGERFRA